MNKHLCGNYEVNIALVVRAFANFNAHAKTNCTDLTVFVCFSLSLSIGLPLRFCQYTQLNRIWSFLSLPRSTGSLIFFLLLYAAYAKKTFLCLQFYFQLRGQIYRFNRQQ